MAFDAGACEASLACSTCHVIVMVSNCDRDNVIGFFFPPGWELLSYSIPSCLFWSNKYAVFLIYSCGVSQDMEYYNKLEDPTDEENDMLDLAFALTDT